MKQYSLHTKCGSCGGVVKPKPKPKKPKGR